MKRKKELYEEFKVLEKELKELALLLKYEDSIPSEDEIHGWAIRMNSCITAMEQLKEEGLEFFKS